MTERTENQVVGQESISVVLGGKTHEIRPLVIRYSAEWRRKSVPLMSSLLGYSKLASSGVSDQLEGFEAAVLELFTTKTDEMLDSFFEYARDLDRKEIEEIATDGEVIVAFMEVFNAFVAPLSDKALPALTKMSRQ